MEKKINLEEILEKEITKLYAGFKNSQDFCNRDRIIAKSAMKEACKQILELAAENAKLTSYYKNGKIIDDLSTVNFDDYGGTYIDKQSIRDVINLIE